MQYLPNNYTDENAIIYYERWLFINMRRLTFHSTNP